MKWILIGFVKMWRALISPLYGQVCKYYPSCSEYGLEALQVHGAIKGSGLVIWRLLRCNPWSHGGVDPVPGSQLERRIEQWWGKDWKSKPRQTEELTITALGVDAVSSGQGSDQMSDGTTK